MIHTRRTPAPLKRCPTTTRALVCAMLVLLSAHSAGAIIRFLREADALADAARKGDAAIVRKLLNEGVDVEHEVPLRADGAVVRRTIAATSEVVKLLLARGADVNAKDTFYNATPLTWAVNPATRTPAAARRRGSAAAGEGRHSRRGARRTRSRRRPESKQDADDRAADGGRRQAEGEMSHCGTKDGYMLRRDSSPSAGSSRALLLSAPNWPSFRGTNAAGTADGKPTAVKWNAATGENVAWKTPVEGVAVSSPIVWGNRVFISTAISSDPKQGIRTGQYGDVEPVADASKHTWRVIALDKPTGKVVWDKIAHEGIPKTKRHAKSSQASATPVTDGRHVIVSFGSEGLYSYDFDGKLLWKKDLGILNAGWFFDPDYEWGIGSSPIIYRNMVIVQADIQRGSFIAAFDTATGKEIWRTQRDEIPSWSTPTIFETQRQSGARDAGDDVHARLRSDDRQGAVEVLRQLGDRRSDADRRSGLRRDHQWLPRPAADHGGQAGGHRRHHAQGRGDQERIHRLGTVRGGPYLPTPVIYGDHLYVLSEQRRAAGLQGRDRRADLPGAARRHRRLLQRVAGGRRRKGLPASEDGDVFVVKAGPAYELLAKNPVGEVLMASPAISDGVIIVRGLKDVFAVGLRP